MNRRTVLLTGAAALATLPQLAQADVAISYTPGMVDDLLAAGQTVFVDFKASWCTTCRAQERVLKALWNENPDYARSVTFVNVDWDDFKDDALTQRLRIPRRSTLVVLKGDKELGRLVADTKKASIQSLMDIALSAAMA